MGIIKEIDDLNDIKKAFVVSLPILTCFWFISIVLFSNNFYKEYDFYVSIILAFCLAFIWYFISIICTILGFDVLLKQNKMENTSKEDQSKIDSIYTNDNVSTGIFIFSFLILCLSMVIEFLWLKWIFSYYLVFSFGLLLISGIYQLIRFIRTSRKYNRLKRIKKLSTS